MKNSNASFSFKKNHCPCFVDAHWNLNDFTIPIPNTTLSLSLLLPLPLPLFLPSCIALFTITLALIICLIFISISGVDIFESCQNGDLQGIVKALSEEPFDVNCASEETGRTLLIDAAFFGHISIVEYLLKLPNIRVNTPDVDSGSTPLHYASQRGFATIVKELLEAGADVTRSNYHGWSSLHTAATRGMYEVVLLLLEAGATSNALNRSDETPLHLAASKGHLKVVVSLLEHGADLDRRDKSGRTPLHLAARDGHASVVKALVSSGAEIAPLDIQRKTPSDLAKKDDVKKALTASSLPLPSRTSTSSSSSSSRKKRRSHRSSLETPPAPPSAQPDVLVRLLSMESQVDDLHAVLRSVSVLLDQGTMTLIQDNLSKEKALRSAVTENKSLKQGLVIASKDSLGVGATLSLGFTLELERELVASGDVSNKKPPALTNALMKVMLKTIRMLRGSVAKGKQAASPVTAGAIAESSPWMRSVKECLDIAHQTGAHPGLVTSVLGMGCEESLGPWIRTLDEPSWVQCLNVLEGHVSDSEAKLCHAVASSLASSSSSKVITPVQAVSSAVKALMTVSRSKAPALSLIREVLESG